MINKKIEEAYKVLKGESIDKAFALELSKIEGEDILDLLSLANKVKNKFAKDSKICTIMNVKSGACNENCKFCSQSLHNHSDIERYPLSTAEEMLAEAKQRYDAGLRTFGIVTSGTGYKKVNAEFTEILRAIDLIHKNYSDMNVCASLGFLSDETTKLLADRNIAHYNINLQTSPEKYNELIATTHSINDRLETIELLTKYNIPVCAGGIIGLGETMEDRINMAFAIKEAKVDVIPLNVLVPVAGTPLENTGRTDISEIVKTFAIYRLIHPKRTIKFAAGRETIMNDFQALIMLSGANGFLSGGYLTTRGRDIEKDDVFKMELSSFK